MARSLPKNPLSRALIVTVLYAGSGYFGLWTAQQRDLWPTLWFPSAVSLTAVAFWGPSACMGVCLGSFLMRVSSDAPMVLTVSTVISNTLEALVGGLVLKWCCNVQERRPTVAEIPKMVLILALITNISSVVGLGLQVAGGYHSGKNLLRDWWSWWSGNAAAVIVIAPIWLWGREPSHDTDASGYHRRIVIFSGVAMGIFLCALPMVEGNTPVWRPTLAFVPQLLIYWSSLTLGARSVAFLGAIVGIVMSLATNVGRGPFATHDPIGSYDAATLFNLLTGTSTLWLSTLSAERNEANRNIAKHQEELESTVRLRTQELEKQTQELEKQTQELGERTQEFEERTQELQSFSYAVSHDLRAPLRGVSSWIVALEEDCAAQLDATGRRHLDRVRAEATRMGKLIEGLLALSRIGATEINRQSVDILTLASVILGRIAEANPDRVVQTVIAPGIVVEADPILCEIALTNLLENAWKFTSKVPSARIAVEPSGGKGESGFRVEDNGAGFDPSNRKRLFIPFQRFHRASEFPGTGIGLATVHRIAQRHGGCVEVQSSPGVGTTFVLILQRDPSVGM